jgi:sodium-type polar flagellar protein MotX
LLLSGHGSPVDYETVYRWLHHSVTADKNLHQRIQVALQKLATRMPEPVLARAKKPL